MIKAVLLFSVLTTHHFLHSFIIAIDPGHGGKFTGAQSYSKAYYEKEMTLIIAQLVADLLKKENIDVILTRTDDSHYTGQDHPELDERFRDIQHRLDIAHNEHADAFISIHLNASKYKSDRGYQLYVPLTKEYQKGSYGLAGHIHHQLSQQVPTRMDGKRNALDQGIRAATFHVLTHAKCPVVLLELEYITNPTGEKNMADKESQKLYAQIIAQGILGYQKELEQKKDPKKFMIGGWIPHWRTTPSIESTTKNIDLLDQISPFSYEIDHKCNLKDTFIKNHDEWKKLFSLCKEKKILIVPTIFWTNTKQMHTCLSDIKLRTTIINQILEKLKIEQFDGININMERVAKDDREHFLAFMRQLHHELKKNNMLLFCCLGGRTSDKSVRAYYNQNCKNNIDFAFNKPKGAQESAGVCLSPGQGTAARRFKKTIATYCDQVHIMGYDEWGLPAQSKKDAFDNQYYVSHASDTWIDQILTYSASYIPKEKLVLGIPTYGLEFGVAMANDGSLRLKKTRCLTYPRALEAMEKYNAQARLSDGENHFCYDHPEGKRYAVYPDGQTIKRKIDIAQKHGIKGVYIFKFDGLEDPEMSRVIKRAA